jgi:hypothetical protein
MSRLIGREQSFGNSEFVTFAPNRDGGAQPTLEERIGGVTGFHQNTSEIISPKPFGGAA